MSWPMTPPKGRRVIWDIESNGLLKEAKTKDGGVLPAMNTIWSGTVEDIDSGEHFEWTPDNIHEMAEWLMDECGTLIGHNIINFDTRATKLIYPKFDRERFLLLDTLVLCKMLWPADILIGPDMKRFYTNRMPAKYIKRQSLGAWGYRLGNYKGEYDGGFERWSQDMQDYMVQDGKVNLDLWRLIERRLGWYSHLPLSSAHSQSGATGASQSLDQQAAIAAESGRHKNAKASSKASHQAATPGFNKPTEYVTPYLPVWIETEMQKVIDAQEDRGVHFDLEAAQALATKLRNEQAALSEKLVKVFGSWWAPKDNPQTGRKITRDRTRICREHPDVTVRRFSEKTGKELKPYVGPPKEYRFAGSVECRIEFTTFNPNSRTHLADRLQRVFGWKPSVLTESGKPQVDEGVIKALPSSVIDDATRKVILDYFVITKTLGMLAEGNKSWLHYVNEAESRIHGRVDPLGTVTSRGAHFNPNLGQIMAVKVDEKKDSNGKVISKTPIMGLEGGFGYEARSLFDCTPSEGFGQLTGTDMSSLEFILLGHYLTPHDGGEFSKRVTDPKRDPHAEHGEMSGLGRRDAKTLGYLRIYGGGAWKAGVAVGVAEDEIAQLLLDRGLPNRLAFMRKVQGSDYEEPSDLDKARIVKGARVIKAYDEAITGLKDLITAIKNAAEQRKYVISLDGRKLIVRKAHAALNTLLQGGGASVCKLWIILFHMKMRGADTGWAVDWITKTYGFEFDAEGFAFELGKHYWQVLWVHDEKQNEHREGLGPVIAERSEWAAKQTGRILKLRGEFRTESKTGRNWAETH